MEEFSLPEDITALNDEELDALLDGAINAFDAMSRSSTVTTDDLVRLRELATGVENIRAEKAERIEAAQKAAAEIEALAATVRGDDPEQAATTAEPTEPAAVEQPAETEPAKETVTAAAVVKGRALDLSRVRAHQPRVLPADPNPRPEITASVDVPGYQPGQALDMDGVTEGIIRRANALKTAGGGVGLTASYRLPFPANLIVNDSSSGTEGTRAVVLAGDQARLNGGDLVASGGWCAPSETVYELTGMSCPEMLWDLPEIQLARGGLRYFPMPSLDVAAMTWVHTEADDISGAVKPCFRIPCPDPVEVRCDAIGACLESGILTQRHFPELVAYYQSLAMVAHEIRIRQELFTQAVAASTPVTIAATFGAFSAIFAAIALQAADMTEKLSLCANINIEVVLPWWSRNLFLADIARQNGVPISDISTRDVINAFAELGISVQWARGLNPTVPTEIGGPTPAVDWPSTIPFLIYPAGTFEAGRGGEISLGVIHDSTKFSVNDYTALFTEECSALITRNNEARVVTVPVCPDGRTGEQLGVTCPIA
ncbi:major capsid protein [Streptomyces sp. NBC_01728]|uniref:major capsid protein n=1 Tax=unclassified Streptomyces TaxID=2593676 RepID=UPI0022551732|nr:MULTISPECIES: major capsid protein [unclassified Streptomyces]MCX4458668.1 major capsid protein [Streptomyces sp. NBC_01719]MCX4498025.1 major capsid protein [Streptomyces sp. NBC_01728]